MKQEDLLKLRDKALKHYKHILYTCIGLAICSALLYWPIRYALYTTYWGSVTYNILAFILIMIICIAIFRFAVLLKDPEHPHLADGVRVIATSLIVIAILFGISTFKPADLNSLQASGNKLQKNQIYVAYSPTCKYCKKADSNLRKALAMYNSTHSHAALTINLDKHNQITNQADKYLRYKGSLLKSTNKHDSLIIHYTMHGKNGQPVAPSKERIYNQLVTLDQSE